MVNKVWQETLGEPTGVDWTVSTIDNSGKLLTTGNLKNIQSGSELLLVKQDANGQTVWQNSVPPATPSSRNYGTAIYTNSSNEVYSAGVASLNGIDANNDFLITKYNSSGSEIWSTQIDSDDNDSDIPTSIISNSAGDVFVTGSSIGSGTSYDFYTMKLNGANGAILWEERYDYANRPDVPVALDFDPAGKLVVVGVSAKTSVTWEIVALKYDSNNGTLLTEQRLSNDNIGFEEPTDLAKDASGNFYIVGRATTDGVNFDMMTAKISSSLNLIWKKKIDQGKEDKATAVTVDDSGNILVTGYVGNTNQGSEFMTLKYKPNGTLLWKKKRTADVSTSHAKAFDIVVDDEDNIVITGNIDYGLTSTALVTQYSPDGEIMWEHKVNTTDKAEPKNILLSQSGEIYVTGISEDTNGRDYFSIKFDRKKRDLIPYNSIGGEALYVRNEVIIRIEPENLNMDFVDDTALRYGKVSDIISNTDAIDAIDAELGAGGDFENWCMIKVHRRLTSQVSTVVSRTGKTLGVPDFWATFILVVSERYDGYNRTSRVRDMLNSPNLKEYIRYAELNRYTKTDDDCPPDDARWDVQGNLHKITYQGVEYDAHINMEPGWCVETGNTALNVAVMDSGLFWSHEDYGDGTFEGSVIAGGYDYVDDVELSANENNDALNHGTRVAGLIGAIRNNAIGVGAIAGGDDGMGGVRIHGYKCLGGYPIDILYDAYSDAVILDGMDIINTSGGSYVNDDNLTTDQQSFREYVHFANRMGIIQIGSMGNDAIEYGTTATAPNGITYQNIARYPGQTQDEWVLSVGGSDLFGNYGGYNYGSIIDVVAPADWQLNRSTSNNPANLYEGISATSGSTPNVTGLAALLASHYFDDVLPSGQNLVQEDIEYIIERTADNIGSANYDEETGFGKINAGNALELVMQPNCKVFHFGKDANSGQNIDYQDVEEDVDITLTEPYINDFGQNYVAGDYTVDVIKAVATFQHDLPDDYAFDDAWVRHSNSTVLQEYDVNNNLRPIEKATIVTVDDNSITLEGYIYELSAFDYIPQSPISGGTDLTYSVLACKLTSTDSPKIDELDFKIFPNPTSDLLGIAFTLGKKEVVRLEVVDAQGKILKTKKWENTGSDRTTDALHVDDLPSGMYYCRLITPTLTTAKKFIKL